ncbi:Splicing factor 3B subunit 4 [Mycena venus]|uniref:Splicing factor 3B subunit 4 n=1 Tax=Mycena venus TaxID=2733690 RepID=A0A8H6Y3Y9_9AGAR|nr:Splicing factor 3B subunit 4 [Mycena venus]
MSRPQDDRNQEATVYLGNLDERCTDALVWELMLQAGPVVNVHLPKDRISMAHQGYGFCEFLTEEDAEYACKIMNQIKLWGKPIRVNKASSDKKQLDVGANLFIGNLDENVDERLLYDTFSAFGIMATTAKIARDPTSGTSKGYGFVSYTDFDASDAAVESMNGSFLMNKAITVQYAFKKDGKGERHGTAAERLLTAQARKNNALPVAARPPAAPLAFGAPVPGYQYQGQFAGILAQPPTTACWLYAAANDLAYDTNGRDGSSSAGYGDAYAWHADAAAAAKHADVSWCISASTSSWFRWPASRWPVPRPTDDDAPSSAAAILIRTPENGRLYVACICRFLYHMVIALKYIGDFTCLHSLSISAVRILSRLLRTPMGDRCS